MLAPRSDAIPLTAAIPRPPQTWRWAQRWFPVLFAHWRVSPELLVKHLPAGVELDIRDGGGWVSVVAFRLNVRLRGLPPVGPCSNFLEMNLRTYVRHRGEPGIQFLSLHADNRLAVAAARLLTPLPYAFARISHTREDGETCHRFDATRSDGLPLFRGEYRPSAVATELAPDTLDWFLLERYHAFVPRRGGRLLRMTVNHPPWQVRPVEARVTASRIGDAWGFDLNRAPDACHFSDGVEARVLPFESLAA